MAHLITHTLENGSEKDGWHPRQILNERKIAELDNSYEEAEGRLVRSIPSPFAPMHLVKEAMLQYVDLDGKISPDTKKVISDALDIGILFFELAEREHLVDALYFSWESTDPKSSTYAGSDRLNAALRLFRKEDGDQYGLNSTPQLHLLTLKHEPHRVFGGTCPETMFFAAPGDKPWGQMSTIGDDILFDHKHALLHERADDYIRWYFALFAALKNSGITDTAFCKYLKYVREQELSKTKPALSKEIAERLTQPDAEYYDKQFKSVTDGAGHDIILAQGVSLRGQKAELDDDIESSFHMKVADGRRHTRMPLAIPQSATGASSYQLIPGEAYNRDKHKPPHIEGNSLDRRTLPGLGTKKYPYLTTDDFFEPTLLRVPYPIDTRFWMSVRHPEGFSGSENLHDYLLPLKPAFFKYFSVAELLSSDRGTPILSVEPLEESWTKVTLDIPLANGGTASFSRKYHDRVATTDDGSTGVRIPVSFGLAMFPAFVDRAHPEHQRIMLNNKSSKTLTSLTKVGLFDSENPEAGDSRPYEVNWSTDDSFGTYTYQPKAPFDAISLSTAVNGQRGYLIPKLGARRGPEKFVFSVDFGTTNTHIEVSRQASIVGPLQSPRDEGYTAMSHRAVQDNDSGAYAGPIDKSFLINTGLITYQALPEELLPTKIGKKEKYDFPIRTASVENADAINAAQVASHTIAVPWGYPIKPYPRYTVSTNLKWSTVATQEHTQKRAEAFIHTLCLMMRAYVLENQGDLGQVELIWFFPTSMLRYEVDKLELTWKSAFEKHFSTNSAGKVKSLPESLAPIYAWRKIDKVNIESRPTVIADIGGGTCDVTIFQAEAGEPKVKRVSSYKFAGNTIFGDGKGTENNNGFLQAFVDRVVIAKGKRVDAGAPDARVQAAREAEIEINRFRQASSSVGSSKSIELINYWFSLAGSTEVNADFDFSQEIEQTPHMRVPFVVYFLALAYKISTDMAAQGILAPKYLAFSGNGSRMLNFLSRNAGTLGDFFDAAFAVARNEPDDGEQLSVFAAADPKPLTAKGGLYYMSSPEKLDADWKQRKEPSRTAAEVGDASVIDAEVDFYAGFVDFLKRFTQSYNLTNDLGIVRSDMELAIGILSDLPDARGHMEELGIEVKANLDASEPISRQMFFFPLERMLPQIARELAQKHSV